jgi:hypothetical protein
VTDWALALAVVLLLIAFAAYLAGEEDDAQHHQWTLPGPADWWPLLMSGVK